MRTDDFKKEGAHRRRRRRHRPCGAQRLVHKVRPRAHQFVHPEGKEQWRWQSAGAFGVLTIGVSVVNREGIFEEPRKQSIDIGIMEYGQQEIAASADRGYWGVAVIGQLWGERSDCVWIDLS